MEIRIYRDQQAYLANHPLYCVRVECFDAFDFNKALEVFHAIYGSSVIILFFCS